MPSLFKCSKCFLLSIVLWHHPHLHYTTCTYTPRINKQTKVKCDKKFLNIPYICVRSNTILKKIEKGFGWAYNKIKKPKMKLKDFCAFDLKIKFLKWHLNESMGEK